MITRPIHPVPAQLTAILRLPPDAASSTADSRVGSTPKRARACAQVMPCCPALAMFPRLCWACSADDVWRLIGHVRRVASYVDPANKWPHEQIGSVKESNRMDIAVLLHRAALVYKDPKYEGPLAKLPAEEVSANRMQILWK